MKRAVKLNPTIFVIFGGTGDLNMRKLAPALYNLCSNGYMPENFAIIGTARREYTDDKFRDILKDGVSKFSRNGKVEDEAWADFSQHLHYTPVDVSAPDTFSSLKTKIEQFKQ